MKKLQFTLLLFLTGFLAFPNVETRTTCYDECTQLENDLGIKYDLDYYEGFAIFSSCYDNFCDPNGEFVF